MPFPNAEARRQRARQLARDLRLRRTILAAYAIAWERIRVELDQLTVEARHAQASGETVNSAWLRRQRRLERLERLVEAEMRLVLDFSQRHITAAQVEAILAGRDDARTLILESFGPPPAGAFIDPVVPSAAVEALVGRVSTGGPVARLLLPLGAAAVENIRDELITGMVRGLNPRVVARSIRTALGGNAARALTIARTEMLGAYRAAATETYKANPNVVTGWYWQADLTSRTCAMCLAMSGTFHPAADTLDSHPNCRCVQVPATRSWRSLGFDGPETSITVPRGADWFARQPAETQRMILGPGKLAAYQDGTLDLDDLVEPTISRRFGAGRRERSLRDALRVAA